MPNEKNKLMLQALNQFGLELKENTTAIVYDLMDRLEQWQSSYGGLPNDSSSFNSDFWQVLCTKEEYKQFVYDLFNKNMDLETLLSLEIELLEHFKLNFSSKYNLISI